METVGDRLKRLRVAKGLSVVELSKIIGVSRISVGNWERGDMSPKIQYVKKYSDYFNVSEDWILNGDNSETVGDRLQHLRLCENKTTREMADIIGVAGSPVVSRWETGKSKPKMKYIKAYADHFNVSESWILNGSEEVDLNKRLDLIEQKLDLILNILQGGK